MVADTVASELRKQTELLVAIDKRLADFFYTQKKGGVK